MRKAKTHFEQVPLEVVKKIIEDGKDIPLSGDKHEKLRPCSTRGEFKKLRAR